MILKQSFFVFFILLLCTSCGKGDKLDLEPPINIEDCQIEEYYARMLINGECWTSTSSVYKINQGIGIYDIRLENIGNLTEGLYFLTDVANNLGRMIFFTGDRNSFVAFAVTEGLDAAVVGFEAKYSIDTESNWIIIDSISLDSTIISGRFEAILYRNGEGNQAIYPSPEKLVITDGQFRVKRKE